MSIRYCPICATDGKGGMHSPLYRVATGLACANCDNIFLISIVGKVDEK